MGNVQHNIPLKSYLQQNIDVHNFLNVPFQTHKYENRLQSQSSSESDWWPTSAFFFKRSRR